MADKDMNFDDAWPQGYSTVMASDLERNGMALELWRSVDSGDDLVAEAFFDDDTCEITTRTFENDTPPALIDKLAAQAARRLPPEANAGES